MDGQDNNTKLHNTFLDHTYLYKIIGKLLLFKHRNIWPWVLTYMVEALWFLPNRAAQEQVH